MSKKERTTAAIIGLLDEIKQQGIQPVDEKLPYSNLQH